MKNSIKVIDPVNYNSYFISGLFQVSTDTEKEILERNHYERNADNKSVLYSPKLDKIFIFHHSDVWGHGSAEEGYGQNLISDDEKNKIIQKSKNWSKAQKILLTIEHTGKGENYIYTGHLGLNGKSSVEKREMLIQRFPQLQNIYDLGIDVQVSESSLTLA